MDMKFEDLKVISVLEQTHSATTQIYLVKYDGQLAVCKSISKQYLAEPKKTEHFHNQITALQHFKHHQHINRFLCTFEDSQKQHIIIKAVMGLPLHKLMQMGGPLPPKLVALVVTQICWILQSVHEQGFIYRDVKASNFMLDRNGKVVLVDLGLSRRVDNKKRAKTVCGTLHAMAPELIQGPSQEGYSFEVDYYGIGILIYQLLTGQPPYGYLPSNPNIRNDIVAGLTQQILKPVESLDKAAADLIAKLVCKAERRLGMVGGIEEILSHNYFKSLNLDEIRQIYEQKCIEKELAMNYSFAEHRSEIEDFGIEQDRYEDIQENDPFFKFG